MKLFVKSIFGLLIIGLLIACDAGDKTAFFKGKNAPLEQAINQDDAEAVVQAIKQGANPNAVGMHGVTPIIVTSGNLKFNAMTALLKHGANPNTYDKNGDNAVTLAVTTYKHEKRYLELLLDNGGDPNSLRPDKDPVIVRFGNNRNIEGIKYLVSKGADVNARSRTGEPLVKSYALTLDWDVVWSLMELGAKYDYTDPKDALPVRFRDTIQTPPSSPQFDAKEKVWQKLCKSGIKVPPLTTKETWDWYFKYNSNRPNYEMPLISCNHESKTIIGEWDGKKPKVVSAYDGLKARGEL